MVREKHLLQIALLVLFLSAASCRSKHNMAPWTAEQKKVWITNTKAFLTNSGVAEKDAVDFANCMFEKTSAEYTFDQAAHLNDEQARKLWQKCDYTW